MRKILFYSPLCNSCQSLFEAPDFEEKFKDHEKVNITESMANLKRFLKYRENLEAYKDIKAQGKVGIPSVIVVDETVEFPWEY